MRKRAAEPEPAEQPVEPGERAPAFMWSGKPVYRCRHCRYERVADLAAVLAHEADAHAPVVTESRILGADGEPLQVARTEE